MRVLFDNVSFGSTSGPNSFGLKLARALSFRGHTVVGPYEQPEVQLSFIQSSCGVAPIVQRLDGLWFNTAQDWRTQNAPIQATYAQARRVVVQSEFDRRLVEKMFGPHPAMEVIHNGTDIEAIMAIDPMSAPSLQGVERVWSCASSWRPHKRLGENIRYFMEHSGSRDCLIVAGANPNMGIADPRVFYAGDLDWTTLVSLYRATDVFLHLALLDHSPNVVVDARAAGCHIVCSSTGGTHEVAGEDATVIEEDEWDLEPFELYKPWPMDFSRARPGRPGANIDIHDVAARYEGVLRAAIDGATGG